MSGLSGRWVRFAALCGLLLGAAGCAVQTQAVRSAPPAGLAARAELTETPFVPQAALQCGPAALATALQAVHMPASAQDLAAQVFLPARRGSLQPEMLAGARQHGAVATRIPGQLVAVFEEIAAGRPVVVLLNLGLSWVPLWHYAVVVGYDVREGQVVLRSGTVRREVMAMRTFEYTWARSQYWGFVVTRPGEWPATAQAADVVEAAVGFERMAPPAAAQAAYASAAARWPGELALALGRGNALLAMGEREAAAQAYEAAARQHRSAAAWINLGATRLALGQHEAALAAGQAALALNDPAWQGRAEALFTAVLEAVRAAGR